MEVRANKEKSNTNFSNNMIDVALEDSISRELEVFAIGKNDLEQVEKLVESHVIRKIVDFRGGLAAEFSEELVDQELGLGWLEGSCKIVLWLILSKKSSWGRFISSGKL